MAKFKLTDRLVSWRCPGCETTHCLPYVSDSELGWSKKGKTWSWSGGVDSPTLAPSVLITYEPHGKPKQRCHFFIRDGTIVYCSDCTHGLGGKTMELPDYDGGA